MVARASVNLQRLARDVATIPRSGMIAAAKASKKIVQDEGRRYGGGDGLKGKKRRALKLRARDDIRTSGHTTVCRVQGSVPAWVWVTSGTDPHLIRRRKRGPMRRMTVAHPGTRGRGGWWRAAARIEDAVPRIFVKQVHEAVS